MYQNQQENEQMQQNMQSEPNMGAQPQAQNTEFNQGVHNLILMRIDEEIKKNPNFGSAIDAALTVEAAMELSLVIPELVPIFKAMGVFEEESNSIKAPQPQNVQSAQYQESDNPLMDDNRLSKGLMA